MKESSYYVEGIINADRSILSQAITLVESTNSSHSELAQQIIEKILQYSGNSYRIGISGIPGVGKSTFIEALGKHITSNNHKLAVLAIDPSSKISKGSILGDKTRMEQLAVDPNAFIRPSPASGTLGGVAKKTREIIMLCEAAGYDIIIIETVGVGQSEFLVHSMIDFFLLLMLPGAGDELQGIKRGIMEIADTIIINKADGDNIIKANAAKMQYENALHLFPLPASGWKPKVDICSSFNKTGIDNVWNIILEYFTLTKGNGYFSKNRNEQVKHIMHEFINRELNDNFYNNNLIKTLIPQLESDIIYKKTSPYSAAKILLKKYLTGE